MQFLCFCAEEKAADTSRMRILCIDKFCDENFWPFCQNFCPGGNKYFPSIFDTNVKTTFYVMINKYLLSVSTVWKYANLGDKSSQPETGSPFTSPHPLQVWPMWKTFQSEKVHVGKSQKESENRSLRVFFHTFERRSLSKDKKSDLPQKRKLIQPLIGFDPNSYLMWK